MCVSAQMSGPSCASCYIYSYDADWTDLPVGCCLGGIARVTAIIARIFYCAYIVHSYYSMNTSSVVCIHIRCA